MEQSEAGRVLAAQRKREPRTCAECGKSFERTTRAVYCSAACKLRAWRRARRAEEGTP